MIEYQLSIIKYQVQTIHYQVSSIKNQVSHINYQVISNEPEECQDTHPLSPSGEVLPYSQGWALSTPIAEMGVFVKLQLQLQFSWKLRSDIALLFRTERLRLILALLSTRLKL